MKRKLISALAIVITTFSLMAVNPTAKKEGCCATEKKEACCQKAATKTCQKEAKACTKDAKSCTNAAKACTKDTKACTKDTKKCDKKAKACCNGDNNNLRLLYWNIQNGMWAGQTDNYEAFLKFIQEKNPDICVWAEAVSNYQTNSDKKMPVEQQYFPNGWEEFAKKYGHNYVYKGGHRDNYPQVITSKYPIENVERIVGAEPDSVVSHGAGWARIVKNGKTINIVTLHTWPQRYAFGIPKEEREANGKENGGDKYRAKEMEYICKHTIEQSPNADQELWMMMGDFNSRTRLDNMYYGMPADSPALLCHDYILEHTPYIDILAKKYPNALQPTVAGKYRIDYVYATPALYNRIKHAEVIWDDYTTPRRDPQGLSNFWLPSDHLPILVDFDMSK